MGAFSFNITASFAADEAVQAAIFSARLAEAIAQLSPSAPSAAPPVKAVAASIATPAISAPVSASPVASETEEAPASSEPSPKRPRGRPAGTGKVKSAADVALPQPATPGATTAPTAPATPVATPEASQAEETSADDDMVLDIPAGDEPVTPPVPNTVTLPMLVKVANVAFKHAQTKYVEICKANGFRSAKDIKPEDYPKIYGKLLGIIPAAELQKLSEG